MKKFTESIFLILIMIPVWIVFHFINKHDRSILFIWRNKLERGVLWETWQS